jgi:2-(3-amino-3-carboxypropyl)histidine synthase
MNSPAQKENDLYDLEIQRTADEIIKRGACRVLIQLPDGLRPQALKLIQKLEELTRSEIFLNGDSCYGACDIAISQAKILDVELIVHYGHSIMIAETGVPVLYIEARFDFDPETLLEKALPLMDDWNIIGLVTTIQHVHRLEEIARIIERVGKKSVIGNERKKTSYQGQILGCDYTTAITIEDEVDGYLYIGAGRFHPLGLAANSSKSVVTANPYLCSVEKLEENEVMRLAKRRMAAIMAAKEAETFAILVSTKPGQIALSTARSLRERILNKGKKAVIICLDEISTLKLGNFTEFQVFVNTACPRLAIDGLPMIQQPILTIIETEILLGERQWEDTWGKKYFG